MSQKFNKEEYLLHPVIEILSVSYYKIGSSWNKNKISIRNDVEVEEVHNSTSIPVYEVEKKDGKVVSFSNALFRHRENKEKLVRYLEEQRFEEFGELCFLHELDEGELMLVPLEILFEREDELGLSKVQIAFLNSRAADLMIELSTLYG